MVENNQVQESAPTDLEDTESNGRGRGFASKAALTIAGGVAMASGMLMGNQMIVPALIGGLDGQGNVQVLNGNGVDAASASELTTSDKALFGNGSESTFSIKAGTAFHNSAFGASDSQMAAAVATATATTTGTSVSTTSVTTQTSTDPAGTAGDTVIVAPAPTWDTTATNTSSATTVAGGGSGTGASGSTGGSYGDDENENQEDHHEDHHEDHEDNDD